MFGSRVHRERVCRKSLLGVQTFSGIRLMALMNPEIWNPHSALQGSQWQKADAVSVTVIKSKPSPPEQ